MIQPLTTTHQGRHSALSRVLCATHYNPNICVFRIDSVCVPVPVSRFLPLHPFPPCMNMLSRVQFFAAPWNAAQQVPLSLEFSWQECWSGLPFPPPGDLPDPGIHPWALVSPASVGGFSTTSAIWEAHRSLLGDCLVRLISTQNVSICTHWPMFSFLSIKMGRYSDKVTQQLSGRARTRRRNYHAVPYALAHVSIQQFAFLLDS